MPKEQNRTESNLPSTTSILEKYFRYDSNQIKEFLSIADQMGVGLDVFLRGEVFDGKYSEHDQGLICSELLAIVDKAFTDKTTCDQKSYLTTAGAPCTGKSTFIEDQNRGENAIYVDPDRAVLFSLQIYKKDCEQYDPKKAYEKWRDASNFIANFMLVKAVYDGLNIVHGTTASSERVKKIYAFLKKKNYTIQVELLFADASCRWAALEHREGNGQVQLTEKDFAGKAAPIFARMLDSYLVYANSIHMYYQPQDFYFGRQNPICFAEYDSITETVKVSSGMNQYIETLQTEMTRVLTTPEDQEILRRLKEYISSNFIYSIKPILPKYSQQYVTITDELPRGSSSVAEEQQEIGKQAGCSTKNALLGS